MSLFEYNCSNIIVVAIVITAVSFIIYKIIDRFNKSNCSDSVIKTIIICVAITACIILSFLSWETSPQFQEGTVTDYVRVGSVGDYMVNYTFYVVDDKGNELVYNTPIISSRKYIRKLENISRNDQILIKYGKKLHYAFDIERIE